jgi:hypothetical protein
VVQQRRRPARVTGWKRPDCGPADLGRLIHIGQVPADPEPGLQDRSEIRQADRPAGVLRRGSVNSLPADVDRSVEILWVVHRIKAVLQGTAEVRQHRRPVRARSWCGECRPLQRVD